MKSGTLNDLLEVAIRFYGFGPDHIINSLIRLLELLVIALFRLMTIIMFLSCSGKIVFGHL